jgi:mRNA-degrading endonuclease RelE of RelBE toxin-antitoxin system
MSKYQVTFARSARRELEVLDDASCDESFRQSSRWHPIHAPLGVSNFVAAIQDEEKVVDVVAVRHRSIAYR